MITFLLQWRHQCAVIFQSKTFQWWRPLRSGPSILVFSDSIDCSKAENNTLNRLNNSVVWWMKSQEWIVWNALCCDANAYAVFILYESKNVWKQEFVSFLRSNRFCHQIARILQKRVFPCKEIEPQLILTQIFLFFYGVSRSKTLLI